MIKSGEASGTLDMVLTRLADMLEGQAMLNRKIISAITYPVLMLFLCLGVIILLLAYVVPQISVIFKERGKALPFITEVIINISDLIRGYWWLMGIIIFFLLVIFQRYIKTTEGRYKLDKLIVTMPIFGHIFLKVATSRLATNLGTMLKSGIELLTALSISKNILSNTYLEETIKTASEGVEQGKSLSMLLSQSQKFPKILIHMTAIGEQTGSLDEMLIRVGKNMETEVEAIVAGLTSLLEPILIIFLAFIVGGILAAVMLPMLEVTSIGK
jgi:general secretion pathway protein F